MTRIWHRDSPQKPLQKKRLSSKELQLRVKRRKTRCEEGYILLISPDASDVSSASREVTLSSFDEGCFHFLLQPSEDILMQYLIFSLLVFLHVQAENGHSCFYFLGNPLIDPTAAVNMSSVLSNAPRDASFHQTTHFNRMSTRRVRSETMEAGSGGDESSSAKGN